MDIDVLSYGLFAYDSVRGDFDLATLNQLRVPFSVRLTPEIALFIAPSVSVSVTDDGTFEDLSLIGSALLSARDANIAVRIWPGFSIGARFF